ncbi:MAG: hypothetical protein EHM24_25220 [Acidobacteria bacterium]|nr:MAG: hypothetical protein EHM24_25220 [Acidobacteriota bacterium]
MRAATTVTIARLTLAALTLGPGLALLDAQSAPAPPTNVRVMAGTPAASGTAVWITKDELMSRPTSGAAWNTVLSDANRTGTPNVGDQDSRHDIYTLASALVCVRTGQLCSKARASVVSAIGTEGNERWLAISRNMTAYIISADLLNLRADGSSGSEGTRVEQWIRSFLTRQLPDNNSGTPRAIAPFHSGSNAAAQEGLVHVAIGAYLRDKAVLDRGWDAFRTFAGDPGAPNRERIDLATGVDSGWAADSSAPRAINPAGTTKQVPSGMAGAGSVRRVDGAIINDMRRGGNYQWPPVFTQYPWTGLAGIVPAAVVLERAGYPALAVANRAVLRSVDYLWFLRSNTGSTTWFDGTRGSEVVQLVNHFYNTSYLVNSPVVAGMTVGYTDWTHPASN